MYTCFRKAAPSEYFWQVIMRGVGGQDKTPCQYWTALDTVGSLGPRLGCATAEPGRGTSNSRLSFFSVKCVLWQICCVSSTQLK